MMCKNQFDFSVDVFISQIFVPSNRNWFWAIITPQDFKFQEWPCNWLSLLDHVSVLQLYLGQVLAVSWEVTGEMTKQ